MLNLKTNKDQVNVGVVGAGLVGCLAALAFKKKGYSVTLFESRLDPRLAASERNLRSINLAVSARGISALKYVNEDMAHRVLSDIIPMKGRMIHHLNGKQESQLYGLFGESINSIDRSQLNDALLNEITDNNISIHFNHKLIKLSSIKAGEKEPRMTFQCTSKEDQEYKEYEFDYIIGADGSYSQFRYQMQRHMRMNFSQEYIDMQYIELSIPPRNDGKSIFSMDANHLHIWPRSTFMLIALPNKDGSFTSTFFSPWSLIESIATADEFVEFFEKNFPDAVAFMGKSYLKESFETHPRGALMQVCAYPYHLPSGRALIIGDAAHLMVPFYGQGMNCGFEDVSYLMQLIDKNAGSIDTAFSEYSKGRKNDLDAICKLALCNYHEMSSKVTSVKYLFRKKVDYLLGKLGNGRFFTWIPMYSMISFRSDIPYSKAVEIEDRQKRILRAIELTSMLSIFVIGSWKVCSAWNTLK